MRIAFFDIDGTLLSHTTGVVPASARQALRDLREAGVLVGLCSGRHERELVDLPLEGLRFDVRLTTNGQICDVGETPVRRAAIDPSDVAHMVRMAQEEPFPLVVLTEHEMVMNYHNDLVRQVQADIHSPLPELGDIEKAAREPVYQMIPYLTSDQMHLLDKLQDIQVTRWHPAAVDVIARGGGKGTGIRTVLDYLGIPVEESCAFGDGENDLDMFSAVGLSVAMGNAPQTVQDRADVVAPHIDEDGLARAIKKYVL